MPGEVPSIVFISSVMDDEMGAYREQAVQTIKQVANFQPWAFEYTPPSSEAIEEGYLRKVREAAIVVWLVSKETTMPVLREIDTAIETRRRLLIFKCFDGFGSDQTEVILRKLQSHVKWGRVENGREFESSLRLAICDEIARALQTPTHGGREDRLDEQWRLSIARCVERWISLQVPREVSYEMALDLSIGDILVNLGDSGFKIITGDVGAGKSLAIERCYQRHLQSFRANHNAAIPVFIDGCEIGVGLKNLVMEKASVLGSPNVQGVAVFIDGADESGGHLLKKVVRECRVLSETWPTSSFLVSCRTLPFVTEHEETMALPLLTHEQAAALITRISGHEISHYHLLCESAPLRESVLRPLFAIIYGLNLRKRIAHIPRSEGELLDSLAEQAIDRTEDHVRTSAVLRQLALRSVVSNSLQLHVSDASDSDELRRAIMTGIIVQKDKTIHFPLIILRDWFAADAIIRREQPVEAIATCLKNAEKWRNPLVIAVAKASYTDAERILRPIISKLPGLAAQIVRKAIVNDYSVEDSNLPPAIECGQQLRSSLLCWINAIGPIAKVTYPWGYRQSLPPIAVERHNGSLGFSWYEGSENMPEVTEMNFQALGSNHSSWPGHYWSVIGRQPAWSWLRTLDLLSQNVADAVKKKTLLPPDGPLKEELMWQWILWLTNNGGLRSESFPIEEVEAAVNRLPDGKVRIFPHGVVDATCLKARLLHLRSVSTRFWPSPSPGRDQNCKSTYIWSAYSDEQLLNKVKDIFAKAIEGYEQTISSWFPAFRDQMVHAVTLPARLVGVVIPSKNHSELSRPWINWYFDPLPKGSLSEISLNLGSESLPRPTGRKIYNRLCEMRPEAASWISWTFHQSVLDIFNAQPATNIVYDWLEHDLKKIGWM